MGDLPEGMTMDAAGTLHWSYEQDMRRKPVVLFLLFKIFFGACAGVGLMMALFYISDGDYAGAAECFAFITFGIGGICVLLVLVAWGILSLLLGGKLCYEFDMDGTSVTNRTGEQSSAKMSRIASFLSLFSRHHAADALAFGPSVTTTRYAEAESMEADRKNDRIKLRGHLVYNDIYASPAQYDFVWQYLANRCPQAERRE